MKFLFRFYWLLEIFVEKMVSTYQFVLITGALGGWVMNFVPISEKVTCTGFHS